MNNIMIMLLSGVLMFSSFSSVNNKAFNSDLYNKERIEQEILTGNITNNEDVLQLAIEQYLVESSLNQPLLDTTANLTFQDDNRLSVKQILNTEYSDEGTVIEEIAYSKLLVLDQNNNEVTRDSIVDGTMEDSGGLNEYSVYAVHTSYYSFKYGVFGEIKEARMNKMTTTLTYGTAIGAAQLIHKYIVEDEPADLTPLITSSTVSSPSANHEYTYYPNDKWYVTMLQGTYIASEAEIYVGSNQFTLINKYNLY